MAPNILLSMDDSENAMRAAGYVASAFSRDSQVTLFSVVPDTADVCNLDTPSLHEYFKSQQHSFCLMEEKKREVLDQAMMAARQTLVAAGFAEANVFIRVQTQKKSVAKDILDEAGKGYDTVVMGRWGHSGIVDFFMGSVPQKVMGAGDKFTIVVVS